MGQVPLYQATSSMALPRYGGEGAYWTQRTGRNDENWGRFGPLSLYKGPCEQLRRPDLEAR